MATILERKIIELIERQGPVTFERFMEIALYDPEYGYYASGKARLGKAGDFYTSPYLHPVFGALIARQIEEMWEIMGRPRDFGILEMGAGAGYACKDILDSLKDREFFDSLWYGIIEINPAMQEEQERLLSDYSGKVRWFASLSSAGKISGCIFSNELLDALPVHLVIMEDELREVYVTSEGTGLKEVTAAPSAPGLPDYFREFRVSLPPGYRTEVNLRIREWLDEVCNALERGFVMTIDYGYTARDYYSEDRNRGTIMCYSGHQATENPLENVGAQDITAHVNFSSLRKWGGERGLLTIGFSGQGAFLIALGVAEELKKLSPDSPDFPFELARIKKLILPQGMGESHSVLIQCKGIDKPALSGFSMRNQLRHL